ncbi:fungal-specific transcription factor domain-containing protein [Mycena epipterygia]|nr:fungal-specific transcription factor domain-containing protein [Mycena epipterygia]
MPSNDEDPCQGDFEATSKKKRAQRACDMCRRKKRRCDGGEICDHCARHSFACTYGAQIRSDRCDMSTETRSYVEALEAQVKTLEARVKTLEALLEKQKTEKNPGLPLIRSVIQQLNSPLPAHSDDSTFAEIDESFLALSVNNFSVSQGFQGKSSGAMLVKAAVDLRGGAKNIANVYEAPGHVQPATEGPPLPSYLFPDDELLMSLISLYFQNVDPFLPLLHRHTFESGVRQKFHLTHAGFGKTVLLVCALGTQYSTDSQPTCTPGNLSPRPPGWRWFEHVDLFGHMAHTHPTIYDLQSYCLAAAFVNCACPRVAWTLVGLGIRLAQDIGAHCFKPRSTATSLEQELEKRASWVLWLFDAQIGTALGRSSALPASDLEIEMPTLCDDEHWNTPIPEFIPPTKPSVVEFFNSMLQLNHILSLSCTLLYSTKRRKMLIGLGDDGWERQVVAELDAALNTWYKTIPEHLCWDPDNPIQHDIFFDQSAALHCMYYHTRIIIHRPLIHAMRSTQDLVSLIVCTSAARACSQLAQIQLQRRPTHPLWFSQTPLFTSAIVLLLNIWGGFASSKTADKNLDNIHHCMGVLSAQKHQWPSANHLLDTLRRLIASERSAGGRDASNASDTPRPNLRSEPQFGPSGEPFPAGLSPPLYDPQLETAPQYSSDDGSWSNSDFMSGSCNTRVFSGDERNYMDTTQDPGFAPPGNSQESNAEDCDAHMTDARTIALWSRAPPNFGVADWDMYLGKFTADMQTSTQH